MLMNTDSLKLFNHRRTKQFFLKNGEESEKIKKKITTVFLSIAIVSGLSVIGVSLFYKVGWNILSMVLAG